MQAHGIVPGAVQVGSSTARGQEAVEQLGSVIEPSVLHRDEDATELFGEVPQTECLLVVRLAAQRGRRAKGALGASS
jgi:hypothetical protein